jgi:CAAX protease family protein
VSETVIPSESQASGLPDLAPTAADAAGALAGDVPGAMPLPPPEPLRNFCTACGTPWQPHWTDCPVCAYRSAARSAATAAEALERSSVAPSLWLYFVLLTASIIGMLTGLSHVDEAHLLIYLSVGHSLIILVWTIWGCREVMPALVRRVNPLWFPLAIVAGCCTFAIATGYLNVLHRMFGLNQIRMTDPLLSRGWGAMILLICVQPAVFEELGFRGVILPALQPTLTVRDAAIVSALLFMTLHLAIASFPHLFLMGLVLAYLRVRSGSLLPGMLMHFTHNFLCILAERWF